MDEETLRLLARIKVSADGIDFIAYLHKLSLENYKLWKDQGGDVLRGKAIQIDELIKVIEQSDERLINQQVVDKEWM